MYGIPGYMQKTHVLHNDISKLIVDPVPGVMKQLVTKTKDGSLQIQYDVSPAVLILPPFIHHAFSNFLIYCHSPEAKSEIYKENYACFLKHAWPEARNSPEFFVCIMHNVKSKFGFEWLSPNTIVIRRPNLGLDFGAHTDALHSLGLDTPQPSQSKFYVFFMNDTVYGPTFPWWIQDRVKWTDIFRAMITTDVKLAGMTINPFKEKPHVQSMLLVTDNIGFEIGMRAKVFAHRKDKWDIVMSSEVGFSRAILEAGFNIDCAAELLHGYDYRNKKDVPNRFSNVCEVKKYGGFSIHPFETMFSQTALSNRVLAAKLQTAKEELTQT